MTMNLQHFASWPRDPDAGYHELCRITEVHPPPDIICVQEGLAGRGVLSELGYQLLASSQSNAQPLRDALYKDASSLQAVREGHHSCLLVNELYMRVQTSASPLEWEVVDEGAARISSDEQTSASGDGSLPLAVRSVVWTKLRHRTRPEGPFVFLLNTQLTGGPLEQSIFSQEALSWERRKQVARVLDFVESLMAEDDLGLFVGDLGVAPEKSDEAHESSPFGLLSERGWRLAYGQAQVGPTSSSGQLLDHMATSRAVPALVKVFATTNQRGGNQPPVTQVPLSDHNVVKATFSMRYEVSEEDKAIIQGESPGSPQHYFIGGGEDEIAANAEEAKLIAMRRKNFPLSFRPDPKDTSYVGMCAHYEFECQDLMNERSSEQQAMEEITASLSEQMWRLRDQCSDQIHGKSVLIQRIQEANDSVNAMNETWGVARATLQAELDDERFQKEQVEAELRAEEEEAQSQIAQCHRQLENMRLARRSLGRHLSSMGKMKAVMLSDIEEERRMTSEISEAGDQHLSEWSVQQSEIRAELNEALAVHRAEHDVWKAQMSVELQWAREKKDEVDAEESDLEQRLSRAHDEMSAQAQELRSEVNGKSLELQELNARIQEVHRESKNLEDSRPDREESATASVSRVADLRKEQEDCQTEITVLQQDCTTIRAHLDELQLSEQAAERLPKSRGRGSDEDVRSLESKRSEYESWIEAERQRQEDLRSQLQMAEQRPGLFSCFFPKKRASAPADPH